MKNLFSILFAVAFGICSTFAQKAPDMTGMELTAQQWNRQIYAGWNLGNTLECPGSGWNANSTDIGWLKAYDTSAETCWGNPKTTKAMITAVKAAGFNAVRIPVRWACHITDKAQDKMTVSDAWLQRVKEVVDYCIDNDMYVIINTHHDMWLEYQPINSKKAENNARLKALWTNIANYFADYDGRLAFAGTNETHIQNNWSNPTAENLAVQNSYLQTFIDAVRATGGKNYYRHLIVQTYACNPYYGLSNQLIVPNDVAEHGRSRMSIEFHYYNPYNYCSGEKGTGYYNYWGTKYTGTQKTAVAPDNEKTMSDFLNQVQKEWADTGLGIVIGEWGISDRYTSSLDKKAIHDNMQYYCKYFITEARTHGFSTFVWDNNVFGNGTEKFGIFNRTKNMQIDATWMVNGIKEGIALGIEEVRSDATAGSTRTYNLMGQPVNAGNNAGILIRDNQKFIVR